MNKEFHWKPMINEIEDQITSLTRVTLTQATGFGKTKTELLTIQILAKTTMAFAIFITTVTMWYNHGNNFQKANEQPSFKRPQTYDNRYPRENKFRENEQVAK